MTGSRWTHQRVAIAMRNDPFHTTTLAFERRNGTVKDDEIRGLRKVAERAGFEPAVGVNPHTLSRRAR